MSFAMHQISLPNSAKNSSQYRLCHFCKEKKPPEGGIELSPRRWLCAVCWVDKVKMLKNK